METQTEKPIIFSAWKVNRILEWDFERDGDMQTRRVLKDQPPKPGEYKFAKGEYKAIDHEDGSWWIVPTDVEDYDPSPYELYEHQCPYGRVGSHLWVREAHAFVADEFGISSGVAYRNEWINWLEDDSLLNGHTVYNASNPEAWKWRPSIFLPRWASRITLEITEIQVERLQDITEKDALAEGLQSMTTEHTDISVTVSARDFFIYGWNEINGKRKGCSWTDNPFCWCIAFRRIK